MYIADKNIDNGRPFDWGKASEAYAKYRDIYPPEFYERIAKSGLCVKGQYVLDLGTGSGPVDHGWNLHGDFFEN